MTAIRSSVLAALALAATVTSATCQTAADVKQAVEAARRSNPGLVVKTDPTTGLPTSIRGIRSPQNPAAGLGSSAAPSEAEVRQVVEAFFKSSELSAAFPQKNVNAKIESVKVRNDPDVRGQSIVHVEQRVNGIPVFGSSGKVTVNPSLAVTQLTASFSTVEVESTTPTVSLPDAIAAARAKLKEDLSKKKRDVLLDQIFAKIDDIDATAQIIVYDPALIRARGAAVGPAKLAYLVSIDSFRIFVDAATKEVLFTYRDQPTAMLRRVYDLANTKVFPGTKVLDEETNERKNPLPADAVRAFHNIGLVRDYYYLVLGRNGFDDNDAEGPAGGAPLESYVRYGGLENAYWCPDATFGCPKANVMVYGPNYADALDIVGHELTHGVISFEANLIYADEPGAVNEALADIFGTLIEFYGSEPTANWVIGEKLPGLSIGKPMRSLANPTLASEGGKSLFNPQQDYTVGSNYAQPDHFALYLKRSDALCESTSDVYNGCVHFNSGILNKFAYLISEGGTQKGVTVTGIGKSKLARIAYRSLTTQLNSSSGLAATAEAFLQSCVDLATSSIAEVKEADCNQVDAARSAVGLAAGS